MFGVCCFGRASQHCLWAVGGCSSRETKLGKYSSTRPPFSIHRRVIIITDRGDVDKLCIPRMFAIVARKLFARTRRSIGNENKNGTSPKPSAS